MRTTDVTVTLAVFLQFNLLFKSTKCFQLVMATILSIIRTLLALKGKSQGEGEEKLIFFPVSLGTPALRNFLLSFLSRDLESYIF